MLCTSAHLNLAKKKKKNHPTQCSANIQLDEQAQKDSYKLRDFKSSRVVDAAGSCKPNSLPSVAAVTNYSFKTATTDLI